MGSAQTLVLSQILAQLNANRAIWDRMGLKYLNLVDAAIGVAQTREDLTRPPLLGWMYKGVPYQFEIENKLNEPAY